MKTAILTLGLMTALLPLGCSDSETPPAGDTSEPHVADVAQDTLAGEVTDTGMAEDTEPAIDTTPIEEPDSSAYFLNHVLPAAVPGRFPASPCDDIAHHHTCVSTAGCNWLRTVKNDGICREDPITRCLTSGECVCRGDDFHGTATYDDDLELFVPLSILWKNLAPRTSTYDGGEDLYTTSLEMEAIVNESTSNFTSRTDFTHKTLSVDAGMPADLVGVTEAEGLTLTMKLMKVWDKAPHAISGTLFEGLGVKANPVGQCEDI